jgi:hypothetical protein
MIRNFKFAALAVLESGDAQVYPAAETDGRSH